MEVLKLYSGLTFMGPCIANVFSNITNKMQRYASYLFLWNALHVSGGSFAHHQELKNCIYSFWVPDEGRRNRLKHVEHFTEINNLCNVASCWLYLKIKKKFYSCCFMYLSRHPVSWFIVWFCRICLRHLCWSVKFIFILRIRLCGFWNLTVMDIRIFRLTFRHRASSI